MCQSDVERELSYNPSCGAQGLVTCPNLSFNDKLAESFRAVALGLEPVAELPGWFVKMYLLGPILLWVQ